VWLRDDGWRASFRSVEPVPESVVELLVDGGEEVAVGAEGDVDRRVAHAFHDRSGVGPLGDKERGVGVPEIMESGSVREPGANDGRFEVAGVPVGVTEGPAVGTLEHEIVLLLAGEVGSQ